MTSLNLFLRICALLCFTLTTGGTQADVDDRYAFSNPSYEERFQQLLFELRCPKCQNQNIADSDASISEDLRQLIFQQLEAGKSNSEIKSYLVDRYGEYILYRPEFNSSTWVLWLLPGTLLVVGLGVVFWVVRAKQATSAETGGAESALATNSSQTSGQLSSEEQQRLQALLARSEQQQSDANSSELPKDPHA